MLYLLRVVLVEQRHVYLKGILTKHISVVFVFGKSNFRSPPFSSYNLAIRVDSSHNN